MASRTRKKTAARKKATARKKAAGRKTAASSRDSERDPTLEEVLTAFQKSLARAQRSAMEVSRGDAALMSGDRPLYVVDGLDVELKVGIRTGRVTDDAPPERIFLDFGAGADARSTISLRVESRPLELVEDVEAQVVLADLDPDRNFRPLVKLRVSRVGGQGIETQRRVDLYLSAAGRSRAFELPLNDIGQADVLIDPPRNLVTLGDGEPEPVADLELASAQELFLWASLSGSEDRSRILHVKR